MSIQCKDCPRTIVLRSSCYFLTPNSLIVGMYRLYLLHVCCVCFILRHNLLTCMDDLEQYSWYFSTLMIRLLVGLTPAFTKILNAIWIFNYKYQSCYTTQAVTKHIPIAKVEYVLICRVLNSICSWDILT